MEYINEDGSLDVERINSLPLDERLKEMGKFSREQMEEYFSKVGISFNESTKPIKVDYKIEEVEVKRYYTIDDIHNILMKGIDET